jgi:serine/threonine protein kinase
MELFSLTSLSAYVRLNRPLPESTLREVIRQLACTLAHLHDKGIAHRDIKPDNILIDESGTVKLIDLGLATDGNIKEVQVAGTPHFMAPELLKSAKYDPMRADLWALGVLLYWLALGYYPGDTKETKGSQDTRRKGVPKLHFPVDMHPGIEYLISKLMREEPMERATAEEVLEDTWLQPRDFRQEISRLTRQLAKQ